MSTQGDGQYDLTDAGFDGFLSRSVDDTARTNLDSPTNTSQQVAFDRNQITGALGDTFRIGRIYFDGSNGTIIMNDGQNDVLLIGQDG